MFDILAPDTMAMNAIVPHSIVWLTVLVSLALTAFLAYVFRGKASFAILCVVGIGIAPLIIFLATFSTFYVYGVSQIAERPIWGSSTFQIATIPFGTVSKTWRSLSRPTISCALRSHAWS
jgi:hypothetical protein